MFAITIFVIGGAQLWVFLSFKVVACICCIIIFSLQLVVMAYLFGNMICTMQLHTPAQLEKYKKTLILFFIAFLFSVVLNLLLVVVLYVQGPPNEKSPDTIRTNMNLNPKDLFFYCWGDRINVTGYGIYISDYTQVVLYQMHIFDIFCAVIFVYIKPRKDVLTGCSKLGDLLKVSVF